MPTEKVICIGSASKDIFFPTAEGMITDTPDDLTSQKKIAFELGGKIYIKDRFEALGGVALNVAMGLAKLGILSAPYACVGDDFEGGWIIRELEKAGVKTNLLEKRKEMRSDLSAIIVDQESGERTIFVSRDANEHLKVSEDQLCNATWLFVSSLCGNVEENFRTILSAIDTGKVSLAFNPGQGNIKTNVSLVIEVLRRSTIVILNKDEATEIVSAMKEKYHDDLRSMFTLLRALKSSGPEIVVITDGKNGAWTFSGRSVYFCDSAETSPVDQTGAGDAFASGFLSAHFRGEELSQALAWGTANAGNVVRFHGAIEGLLGEEKIKRDAKKVKVEKQED